MSLKRLSTEDRRQSKCSNSALRIGLGLICPFQYESSSDPSESVTSHYQMSNEPIKLGESLQ